MRLTSYRLDLIFTVFIYAVFSPFSLSSDCACQENRLSRAAPSFEDAPPPEGLGEKELGRWLADRALIYHHHRFKYGKYPNLEKPRTFTEKIHYRMLYDRRPILTLFADKILVRDYVRARVGEKYLTTIYQIAKSPEEIDWSSLPERYFAKTNHGSSMNIFMDPFARSEKAIETMKGILRRWLNTDYSDYCGEWCYRNIPEKVVYVEEDLGSPDKRPIDWKFHLFDGKVYCFSVHKDRRSNFYDRNLRLLNVKQLQENFSETLIFPDNMEEMFFVAERLAEGMDYVRVDLYNIDGRIVFGELTNYPHAGLAPFDPPEFDDELGAQWKLIGKVGCVRGDRAVSSE